ncbi:D-alanyl-lipoteichoic acid biosynthesis protein DltB [Clostridium tyrobutyricum]|jgi:membrane protein involved in D-alanine export|uniref:D-alanyl-lipoteichoic acid biosynthesis protein DltB n=1 Tax=Clostridium tyrobutyricum TaxID=1519 RepID=UPI000E99C2B8|nr:D-alanyl-lipoteichoic acid biosynthesis protein DltB [Clostridium tyrobutyricum]HBG37832.1 D-alanyl-lipoteichoic acid biosynthesis protein DltB [Clostridiaceae bacterium]HCL49635.1 D-alanyl-lipoteichoic acid biosynthesis protein DltB [Clostridiaceae bacterium]
MLPFSGLFFFYILFIFFIGAIILGILGKPLKWYGFFVNLFMLWLIFGNSKKNIIILLMFLTGELALVEIYIHIRKHFNNRWILWIMILFSILPLILTKWGEQLIHRHVALLGISYLTFKVVQVLIETYDGLIDKMNPLSFTYFLLFFPTISSGPIDRSRRFLEDISHVMKKEEYIENLRRGIYKLGKGAFFKFFLGAIVSNYWMAKIPTDRNFINILNYMYAYSFYLYFDFAGYSFMAVGTSYIFGIKTPDNFNIPYLSHDIKEFWNRWHMSLSFWFRDFIYTRIVMSFIKNKVFKNKYTASYIGFIITMFTMGAWHGTQRHYLVYGLYHGILICFTDYFERKSKWYKSVKNNEKWDTVFTFVTFNLVCFGFLIFSGKLFI